MTKEEVIKEKVYLKGMIERMDELESNGILSASAVMFAKLSINHKNFLKQPLCISQFVACKLVDGVWVIIEEPKPKTCCSGISRDCGCMGHPYYDDDEIKEFQEAQQRCLFSNSEYLGTKEGKHVVMFENENSIVKNYIKIPIFEKSTQTIEDLTKYNLELSQTAVKTLNL